MEFLNSFLENGTLPLLSAFFLGILTSISPCPLATNIAAVAFIAKDIKTPRHTILSGIFYTLGRGSSYTLLAVLIYFGFSSFKISTLFQGWGDKILGPALILIGLSMLDFFKISPRSGSGRMEEIKKRLSQKGFLGSFLLGMFFALAFCPYSGVLFFGALIPLVISSPESLLLPPVFALGTGLPVILFSFLIAFSAQKLGQVFRTVQKTEKIMRRAVAIVFIGAGIYYLKYLWIFIFD